MTPIHANGVLKRHTEQISQTYIFGRDIRHWYVPSGKEFLLEETFALNLVLFFFQILQGLTSWGELSDVFHESKCANVVLKKKEKNAYELQHFMRNLSFSISNVSKSEFISLSIWNYLKLRHRASPFLNFWRRFLANFLN